MSKAEFQKLHDEMRALRTAGKHDEFVNKFCAKGAIFMSPIHDPMSAADLGKIPKRDIEINVTIDDLTQIGDIVIDRCTLTADHPTGKRTGWNLTVWVKEGGAWKIRNSCLTFKLPSQ